MRLAAVASPLSLQIPNLRANGPYLQRAQSSWFARGIEDHAVIQDRYAARGTQRNKKFSQRPQAVDARIVKDGGTSLTLGDI